jgi:hypothetical protein
VAPSAEFVFFSRSDSLTFFFAGDFGGDFALFLEDKIDLVPTNKENNHEKLKKNEVKYEIK